MKKVLLFAIIALLSSSILKAQISQGSVLLGGGVNISNTKYENDNLPIADKTHDNNTSINPAIGIAIKDNLVFGIALNYGHSENTTNSSPMQIRKIKYNAYGAGVFLRKYLPLGKNFYLFGQGDLNYTNNKQSDNYIPSSGFSATQKGWNSSLSFSPGISYALTKKFHLETSLSNLLALRYEQYRFNTLSNGTQTSQERRSFGFNSNASPLSNFNIGFRFLFAK
jgi:hypothetical protein